MKKQGYTTPELKLYNMPMIQTTQILNVSGQVSDYELNEEDVWPTPPAPTSIWQN